LTIFQSLCAEAAASLIGPQIYEESVFPFEKKMVDAVHSLGTRVRLHICGNTTPILSGLGRLGCEIVDLDWMVSLAKAREAMEFIAIGPELLYNPRV
jgi:uroporphyrinogen-III decarboxylase